MSKFPWEVSAISTIVGVGLGYALKVGLDSRPVARENPRDSKKLKEAKKIIEDHRSEINKALAVLKDILKQKKKLLALDEDLRRSKIYNQKYHRSVALLHKHFKARLNEKIKRLLKSCSARDKAAILEYLKGLLEEVDGLIAKIRETFFPSDVLDGDDGDDEDDEVGEDDEDEDDGDDEDDEHPGHDHDRMRHPDDEHQHMRTYIQIDDEDDEEGDAADDDDEPLHTRHHAKTHLPTQDFYNTKGRQHARGLLQDLKTQRVKYVQR